jgi:hypothetical protein
MASDEISCVDEKSGQELGERHWKQAVFTRLLDATKKVGVLHEMCIIVCLIYSANKSTNFVEQ